MVWNSSIGAKEFYTERKRFSANSFLWELKMKNTRKEIRVLEIVIFIALIATSLFWTASIAGDESADSIVREYINGLKKGNIEVFFSHNFYYRTELGFIRKDLPKAQWEEKTKERRSIWEKILTESIGQCSQASLPVGIDCTIFGDSIDSKDCYIGAFDYLHEPGSDLKATLLEIRPGPIVNLNLENHGYGLGIYEGILTWEAFIYIEYLRQDTAPKRPTIPFANIPTGGTIKNILLKMNIINLTSKVGHILKRAEQLGFAGFSVDGVTEILKEEYWEKM